MQEVRICGLNLVVGRGNVWGLRIGLSSYNTRRGSYLSSRGIMLRPQRCLWRGPRSIRCSLERALRSLREQPMSHNSCINHKCYYWAIRAMADMQLLEDGRLHDGTHNGVHAGAVTSRGEDRDLHCSRR